MDIQLLQGGCISLDVLKNETDQRCLSGRNEL